MKFTILFDVSNGSNFEPCLQAAVSQLKNDNHEIEIFDLNECSIKYCIGCFGCWVKTPGVCIHKDDMTKILKSQMKSDWVIYLCSMKAGTVSYKVKTAIDRNLPLVLPYIGVYEGESHHDKRYDHYPNRAFLILDDENISDENLKILEDISSKNALNMHAQKHVIKVVNDKNILECLYEIIDN